MTTNIEFLANGNMDIQPADSLLLLSDAVADSSSLISFYALESFPNFGTTQPKAVQVAGMSPDRSDPYYGDLLIKSSQEGSYERSKYITGIQFTGMETSADGYYKKYTGVLSD